MTRIAYLRVLLLHIIGRNLVSYLSLIILVLHLLRAYVSFDESLFLQSMLSLVSSLLRTDLRRPRLMKSILSSQSSCFPHKIRSLLQTLWHFPPLSDLNGQPSLVIPHNEKRDTLLIQSLRTCESLHLILLNLLICSRIFL